MNNTNNMKKTSMNNIDSEIPAPYRSSLLTSIEALKNSKWWQQAQEPQIRDSLPTKVERWKKSNPDAIKVMARMIEAYTEVQNMWRENKRKASVNIIILLAIILYTISPVDAMPDPVPIIGWLDDLSLLSLGLRHIMKNSKSNNQESQ